MITELKISRLRHFVLIAELGSFHAAAERVHRTQPAISLSIRELERSLGAALFEKGRKAELTPLGQHCLPIAKEILARHDRGTAEMLRLANKKEGSVSIAAVPSVASQLLPPVIERFAKENPAIRITMTDDTARNVESLVRSQQVDFGITSRWQEDAELDFQALMRDTLGLVCRHDHPAASARQPLTWQDLERYQLIDNGTTRLLAGTPAQDLVTSAAHFRISNMISLVAMLEANLGVSVLPRLALPPGKTTLCFVALSNPTIERELGILRPAGKSLLPAAASLDALIKTMLPRTDIT